MVPESTVAPIPLINHLMCGYRVLVHIVDFIELCPPGSSI
jgi:hypothetical protein